MNNINIALLTALYNGKSNLYKEIYFPIVEFALACCLKEAEDKRTSSIDELHAKINHEFGIFIPSVVIKKAIGYMKKSSGFRANLMDGGILQVHEVDMSVLEDTYNKGALVDASLQRLEKSYIDYFQKRDIIPEKSFIEFFSAKTQEIKEYLGSEKPDISMGEKYTHNVRYLSWLKENDTELYESANKVLWGAIVAGFLGRDDYEFGVKPVSECRYYLDTSIIMGCLDLSYEQTARYSQELLQIIKASSSIACIHPLTLDEITRIIRGVEGEGFPRYGTPIYEAFERRKLTCSQLANIRLSLKKLIEDIGVEIHPNNENILKIKKEYGGKSVVKKLETQRADKGTGENPRDIHDAYMIDFIRKQNGDSVTKEKVKAYFITTNDDLRKFSYKYCNSSINPLIASSSVILDLWLHGSNLKSQAGSLSLTETMSRCLALNEQTATPKIRQILKCLDSEELNNPKVRQEVVNGIIERSHKYISSDVEIEQNDNIKPDDALRMYRQAEQDLNEKGERVHEMKNLQDENIRIQHEKENLEDKVRELEEKEKLRKNLKEQKKKLEGDLAKLEPQRRCAVRWVSVWIGLEVFVNLIIFSLFVFFPSQIASVVSIWDFKWGSLLESGGFWEHLIVYGILVGGLYVLFLGKRSRILNFKKYREVWAYEHPEYDQRMNELKKVKQELENL